MEEFRILLRLLPSLTSLDLTDFASPNDDHLVVLSIMRHLRLRTLKLDNRSELFDTIGLLVNTFGSTLEVLHVGLYRRLDAATLLTLGAKCNNVKELRITCGEMLPEMLAFALGPDKFPLLEVIDLGFRGISGVSPINDDVVSALCVSLPNFESITAEAGYKISLSSIAVALTHCPRFREINTAMFEFTTVTVAEEIYKSVELPYYLLAIQSYLAMTSNFRATFEAITNAPFYKHRIREIECDDPAYNFSNDEVAGLIDKCGKYLYTLRIHLGADVSHLTLQRLFRECVELRALYLDECTTFTDELVMMLPDHCHRVLLLSLAGANNITNMSMCYLLQRMGQRLLHLYIEHCQSLTNPTLITIAECCTSLEVANITGTGISADAVITHLIKPNRFLRLVDLLVDPQTLKTLEDFVEKKENGAVLKEN